MPNEVIEYDKFQWHFGVVEDRNDPLRMGRIKVRFYNVHSANLDEVATSDLPWATIINNPSNASMSGVGGPTVGIVEGSWVIGFFMDQGQYQKPMILGTISGAPMVGPDVSKGFSDPKGKYPRTDPKADLNKIGEPDLTRLARGERAETHLVMKRKRVTRAEKVPTAKAPELELQDNKEGVDYENKTWDEPHPRNFEKYKDIELALNPTKVRKEYKSKYPYNKVIETESGHAFEVDDSPNAERIHMYHKSGTFVEVMPDGTKSTKIIGSDYEITLKDKDLQVSGNLNITVNGDAKFLVQGDKYEEIEGNYFLSVRKDKIEKIGGNHLTEIITDKSVQINGNNALRVSGNDIRTIDGTESITVGGTHDENIVGNTTITVLSDRKHIVAGTDLMYGKKTGNYAYEDNLAIGSSKNFNMKAVVDMQLNADANQSFTVGGDQSMAISNTQTMNITGSQGITASVTNVNNDMNITGTSTATTDHVSAGKSGATHTHTDTEGLGAGTTSSPD